MSKKTGVSIVIPSFNDYEKSSRLIDSVYKSSYKNIEVIVVDNSPTKKVINKGKKSYKKVKWVDAGRNNIGQAQAYNIGFAHAKPTNHILYCDSDVIVDRDMITHLVARTEKSRKVGIVTPMILYLEDKNWVNQAGAEVNLKTGRVSIGWGEKKDYLKPKKVQGSGTTMLFTRDLVDTIGGFEDWFLCYFDPEYCVRALKAGFNNWYEPKAICYHDQPKDDTMWRPRVLSRAYLLGRNRTLFMRKYGNMFIYTLMLPLFFTYYLSESIRFNILNKWLRLVWGTIVGYIYPVDKSLYRELPDVKK